MSDENFMIGYGSLINPESLIARFEGVEAGDIGEIYDEAPEYPSGDLLRDEVLEQWDEMVGDIHVVPVKLEGGFERRYSHESDRSGGMLDAVYDDEGDGWINGVLVTGLDDSQFKDVADTETGYDTVSIAGENIDPYISDELMADMGVEIPGEVEIFVPEKGSEFANMETDREKNQVYHDRILKGIDLLGEMYGETVANEFREDYLRTTEEKNQNPLERGGYSDAMVGQTVQYWF